MKLHEIVKQYIDETEAYDRTVCTGPIVENAIMPANHHERHLITKNAKEMFYVKSKLAKEHNYTVEEFFMELRRQGG